jgi:hypothetical protein
MQNKSQRSLLIFLGGATAGGCLSLIIGLILFSLRAEEARRSTSIPIPTATIPSQNFIASSTPTQITKATPLDEAEDALNTGHPENVRELLYPKIESWTSNDDRIRGYKLLGQAELAQGHAQLAVPYFEKLYFYQPTPENLYFLATVYDMGGDIRNALVKYQELANWENLPPEMDRESLHFRIDHIRRALGMPVPTYTPFP